MRTSVPFGAGHGCKPCLGCDGVGWRIARAGEEPVDEYLATTEANRKPWEEDADAQRRLEHTERLLRLWEAPDSVGFAWEERRDVLHRSGSFAELEACLRRLHPEYPARFSQWWRIIVCAEPVTLTEAARFALDGTSELLAAWMPERIRVPRRLLPENGARLRKTSLWRGRTPAHERVRSERDLLICEQRSMGWPPAQIARYHGLDKRRVNQILASASQGVAA